MTVYVDNMRASFGRMVMCHMLADTDAELCEMAMRIGVDLQWHQGDHFDICLAKRAMAVHAGAIEVTLRQAGAMRLRRRIDGHLGAPGDAEQWAADHFHSKRSAAA